MLRKPRNPFGHIRWEELWALGLAVLNLFLSTLLPHEPAGDLSWVFGEPDGTGQEVTAILLEMADAQPLRQTRSNGGVGC